jgi:VIT1/CCC1 family predicted Fe2+/Mn2+ transporter
LGKERLTVSLDADVVAAAHRAVAAGRADSVSAWVSQALGSYIEHERRRQALRDAVAAYEAEFGAITEQEIAAQSRADREAAVVVREPRRTTGADR